MNYGTLLDNYQPEKECIYKAFDDFFNHPLMTKVKDVENFSMFMTKTYCLLSNECRFLVAFVPQDSTEIGSSQYLHSLKWVSFQTRTLPEFHDLESHGYTARMGGILSDKIQRVETQKDSSFYKCDTLPLSIVLLHRKDSDYQDRGTIISALETYNTIITFTS